MRLVVITAICLVATACATPARMHDEAQLNRVAVGCGLALGELIQDDAQKKLLLAVRSELRPRSVCVAQWARRNGLRAVFVHMDFPS